LDQLEDLSPFKNILDKNITKAQVPMAYLQMIMDHGVHHLSLWDQILPNKHKLSKILPII